MWNELFDDPAGHGFGQGFDVEFILQYDLVSLVIIGKKQRSTLEAGQSPPSPHVFTCGLFSRGFFARVTPTRLPTSAVLGKRVAAVKSAWPRLRRISTRAMIRATWSGRSELSLIVRILAGGAEFVGGVAV